MELRDVEEDSSSSHETRHLKEAHVDHFDRPPDWTVSNTSASTLRQKWSPFPYRTTLILLLLPLALAPVITLSASAETASQSYIRGRSCYPNGLWKFSSTATWEIMDSSYFFTPNLSFGNMSFTQVKVIDIAWDLIVGRGGQLGLAYVNYRVFNEWLVWHAEQHRVNWKLYASVAFETTSLSTLGVLSKESLHSHMNSKSWKRSFRWLTMMCMFLSTLYVLSFPTLMAAMTGYIAKSEAYVQDYDGNLIDFEKSDAVQYVVNDATRIGYARPLVAGQADNELGNAVREYMRALLPPENGTEILLRPYLEQTTRSREFLVDSNSQWNLNGSVIELSTPSLNITIHPVAASDERGLMRGSDMLFVMNGRQGTLYTPSWMLDHGSCKPGETYQWGFSYIFLFIVSIFNFVWACIMVGMWFDTMRGSRLYRSGRRPGLLRSVVEYAAAIREEVGDGVDGLEEEGLRKRLRRSEGRLGVPDREFRVRRVDTGDGEGLRNRGWKRNLTRGSTF